MRGEGGDQKDRQGPCRDLRISRRENGDDRHEHRERGNNERRDDPDGVHHRSIAAEPMCNGCKRGVDNFGDKGRGGRRGRDFAKRAFENRSGANGCEAGKSAGDRSGARVHRELQIRRPEVAEQ